MVHFHASTKLILLYCTVSQRVFSALHVHQCDKIKRSLLRQIMGVEMRHAIEGRADWLPKNMCLARIK
jgi:hypothetical protein